MNIVILGAGRIGAAVGATLSSKNQVELWDADTTKVPQQKPFTQIIPTADLLFLCIPSWTLRAELEKIKPLVRPTTPLIIFAKGLEENTNKTPDEICAEILPPQPIALFAGPMMAEELQKNLGGLGLIATADKSVFTLLEELFAGSQIDVVYSTDVHGAALAGILKNIYAMSLGIADSLEWGSNRKGFLFTTAIQEMEKIVAQLGGQAETVLGLAGLGDLICTGFSPYSRNRATGEELLKAGGCTTKSECCVSLLPMTKLIGDLKNFPLLETIRLAFLTPVDIRQSFEKLLPTR